MLSASVEYEKAINGAVRRVVPLVTINIVDPDIEYTGHTESSNSIYSKPEEVYNKVFAQEKKYATVERDRWALDGTWDIFPDDPADVDDEIGWVSKYMSDEDGYFQGDVYYIEHIENVKILQAACVYFPGNEWDGTADAFNFTILGENGQTLYSQSFSGNRERAVFLDGFTVENVGGLRIDIYRWSLGGRNARIIELVPGIYEEWTDKELQSIDVLQETALDCLTLPYGTCDLVTHNKNKRFNPYSKGTVFRSIEERQEIDVKYGVRLANGNFEYVQVGKFFQKNGGWESSSGLTAKFKLVDIVGLLSDRAFIYPGTGTGIGFQMHAWLEYILSHLGEKYKDRYIVDEYVRYQVYAIPENRSGNLTCGQFLRNLCMACRAFFCADKETGYLKVTKIPETPGIILTSQNIKTYPEFTSAGSFSQIIMKMRGPIQNLDDFIYQGDDSAADSTLTIDNPLILNQSEARDIAEHLMGLYGKNKITIQGRGDMRSELGDLDTFDTGFGTQAKGIRYKQQLRIANGVMTTAPSYLWEV